MPRAHPNKPRTSSGGSYACATSRNPVLTSLRNGLAAFDRLINKPLPESAYQGFLNLHPWLIDPQAIEIKQQKTLLGKLFPDFQVRQQNGEYIMVEIETPATKLFKRKNGKPEETDRFKHAEAQLTQVLGLINDDRDAIRRYVCPELSMVSALLVIGLRAHLNPAESACLRHHQQRLRDITIRTFDDLLANGDALVRMLEEKVQH